jgi:hypothetical protein
MVVIQFGEWLVSFLAGWLAGRRAKSRMLRVENHDRYLSKYHEFTRLFDRVQFDGKVDQGDLLRFKGATHEARWLFGPEIPAYAGEVFDHGRKLWLTREQLREMPPADERPKIVEAHEMEIGWFLAQYRVAADKFTKYLDLNK